MSVFAGQQTIVPIPFDEPHTITVRKLTGKQLEKAAKARQAQSFEDVREMGGAAFMKELQNISTPDQAPKVDPFTAYDVDCLLKFGLVSWTYERDLTPDALDELDADAREFFARAVYDASKRKSEADVKNS